ncbi:MAG: hypothetical protein ACLQLG_17785 [Thermoguttaceae bacterium]
MGRFIRRQATRPGSEAVDITPAITACIVPYTIWTALYKIGLARTPMTILENNCMQSTASSAAGLRSQTWSP